MHPFILSFLERARAFFAPANLARLAVRGPRDLQWGDAVLFALLLVPVFYIGAHAAPQSFDFCIGRFAEAGFWTGLYAQYNIYGHQFLGRTLNLLPMVLVSEFTLDYFYVYALFIILALASFIVFSRWMVLQILPTAPRQLKLTAAISLSLALLTNAPTVRELVFSLFGFFTYALPGLWLAIIFLCLYRALAASRDFTWPERILLLVATPLISLSNEWSGLALMALLLCAFVARLRLVPEAPAPVLHAILLALSVLGAIGLLLGPQNPIFSLDHLGMGIVWSLLYTPEFFVLRLPLPGTLGWFLLLALSYRPELRARALSDRHRQLLAFTLVSLLMMSFIAFAFGYLPSQSRLPAREQNELYVVVVVALSVTLCLVVPIIRDRLENWRQGWPLLQRISDRPLPLLTLALILSFLSPAVLGALWQMQDTATFRTEARTRLALMVNRAEPTVYLPPMTVQPSLLVDRDMSADPNDWRNSCAAEFFKLDRLLPQPHKADIGQ